MSKAELHTAIIPDNVRGGPCTFGCRKMVFTYVPGVENQRHWCCEKCFLANGGLPENVKTKKDAT